MPYRNVTRRELLKIGAATAAAELAAVLLPGCGGGGTSGPAPSVCSKLTDIEHVVIFIQENRSFDHYFGAYRGVRGFDDTAGRAAFSQPGYPAPGYGGHLLPYHLDSLANGECTHDITHDGGPQHRSSNGGGMDGFVREHLAAEGIENGPL